MDNDIGNIMSRLQGLKHVSGRRVKELPEFMQNMEEDVPDVSGTAQPLPNFANLQTPQSNIPEADMGGSITPQSYDVRANVASNPEQEGIGASLKKLGANLFNSFGKALSLQTGNIPAQKAATPPPIETQQVQASEGLPITDASQEQMPETSNDYAWSAFGNALNDYVKPYKSEGIYYGESTPENALSVENAQLSSLGLNPDEVRADQEETRGLKQKLLNQKIDKALENPTSTAVYGASDVVANQPELNEGFKKITGVDFTPELAKQTAEYEKVLDDMDNANNLEGQGYTDQEKRILERIQNNAATDADKYFIGMAVLMPLMVGAFFGKEAALGALGGGAQGFANILGNRKKEDMESEKLLADIGHNKAQTDLKRSEIDLKRLGLPAEIQKNLPKQPNEHLIDKERATWIDPKTGQQRNDGVKIKPGLVAYDEFVTDKEELKEMRKEAAELSPAIVATKEIYKLTDDIIKIASQLKDKNIMGQALSSIISGKNPGLATKLGDTIEFDGQKVNSYVVLEHKLKLLVDAYRQAKGMRALTSTVQEHIDSLFRNPEASFQSNKDTIDQMRYTRDLAQSRLMNTVEGAGFVPEFVMKELQPNAKAVNNTLNKKEGEKEASELLRG